MHTYIPFLLDFTSISPSSVSSDVFERKKIKLLKHLALLHRTSREDSTERSRTICLDIWQEEHSDQGNSKFKGSPARAYLVRYRDSEEFSVAGEK